MIFEALRAADDQQLDWNHPETIVSMATKARQFCTRLSEWFCRGLCGALMQAEHSVLGVNLYSELVNKGFFLILFLSVI